MNKDFWTGFSEALFAKEETRPSGPGWIDYQEVVSKYGKSQAHTSEMLNDAVRKGNMERFVGTVQKGTKLVRRVWFRATPATSGIKQKASR